MARIATLERALEICFEACVTPFVWGHRGMGKSSVVRQYAAEAEWGFVDLRCSQLEAADLRGLPERTSDGRTRFLPPADLPVGDLDGDEIAAQLGPPPGPDADLRTRGEYLRRLRRLEPRRRRGILLLDELNRAADDVLQAAFQLVLDRAVGEYVLPPGWHVVAAGNFATGSYRVNDWDDAAFLDRFCHLVFPAGAATSREWADWMQQTHGPHAAAVLDFVAADIKHLDGDVKGGLGFEVTPSRRSWDAVARVLAVAEGDLADPAAFAVVAGLIGRELATAFRHFRRGPVRPDEVLDRGTAALAPALAGLDRPQLVGLMGGLVRQAGPRLAEPTVAEAALDFAAWLAARGGDRDLALAFCRDLAAQDGGLDGSPDVRAALVTNPRLGRAVALRRREPVGFLDRLAGRPELYKLLADAAWGAGTPA
jgi:MoxR-like ATPase